MNNEVTTWSLMTRIFGLLNARERKRSVLLLVGIFLNTVVEVIGLAAIIPFIGIVIQPETIETNRWLSKAFEITSQIGIDTHREFMIFISVVLIAAFVFKALFGLAVNLVQTRFSFEVAHRLTGQLWKYHFTSNLERMRSSNSGRLLAEINSWPIQFASVFLVGGLMLLSEAAIILILSIGLLLYNPLVFAGIAGILIVGTLLIRAVTSKRLSNYSRIKAKLDPETNTLITSAFRGFIEVTTFRASDAVREVYQRKLAVIYRIISNVTVLNFAPAKLYEVLAVIAISGSIILALMQGTPQSGFLELLTYMAICAYRIMPSMSRLNTAIMRMTSSNHILTAMEVGSQFRQETVEPEKNPLPPPPSRVDVAVNNLSVGYEASDFLVIESLTCSFNAGQINGIVGPSGAGKSTLVNVIWAY